MRIGESITKLRKEHHLNQKQLAEMLQVSRQTISNWENEKNYLDLGMIVTISNKFDLSLDQILKEDKKIITAIDNKIKKKINI